MALVPYLAAATLLVVGLSGIIWGMFALTDAAKLGAQGEVDEQARRQFARRGYLAIAAGVWCMVLFGALWLGTAQQMQFVVWP